MKLDALRQVTIYHPRGQGERLGLAMEANMTSQESTPLEPTLLRTTTKLSLSLLSIKSRARERPLGYQER